MARLARVTTLRHPGYPRLVHVLLEDADGAVGLGETFGRADAIEALVHEHAAALVGGLADEEAVGAVVDADLYGAPRAGGGWSVDSAAASALALAAADLAARRAGVPLAAHLGGVRRREVALYVTAVDAAEPGWGLARTAPPGAPDDGRAARADPGGLAAAVAAEGFGMLKLWPFAPGSDPAPGLEAVRAARAAGIAVAVDLYAAHPAPAARALARALDPLGLAWIEDPLSPTRPAALARLARGLATPVAAGESLAGLAPLVDLVRAGAVGVLHVDLAWCGGPRVALAAAAEAAARGVPTTLHGCGGPVAWAAGLHVAAALELPAPLECTRPALGWSFPAIADGVPAALGGAARPAGPGHGVALAAGYRAAARARETIG